MALVEVEELESMDTTEPEDLIQDIKQKVQQQIEEETPQKEELQQDNGDGKLKLWQIPVLVVNPFKRFRCRNVEFGCSFTGLYPKVAQHEKTCDYDVDNCPLDAILNCGWSGHELEFANHCYETHPGLTFAPNGKCSLWPCFTEIEKDNKQLYLIILAYSELFYCRSYVSESEGLVLWAVYYVGNPADASKFCFEVDFEGEPIGKKGCYSIKRRCQPVTGQDVSFKEDGCGILFYKMLKNLCALKDLVYFVRIQKGEY